MVSKSKANAESIVVNTTRPVSYVNRRKYPFVKLAHKDNAKSRRLVEQMAFWDRKWTEYEADNSTKTKSRRRLESGGVTARGGGDTHFLGFLR
ncbi:hypothetical protein TCT1_07840 [Xenorhabdus sp. TCT-1]|uniref:Integrase n=1 Tax=Xenorhabdus taiwanensis TaxID=3085177 RepID=A0ABM8JT37_9GAMM|nr:hypothetical protein TCT1_07840 [Xenorhabdus sp. TCT-1]